MMERGGMFIQGIWCWDKNILTATDENGKIIDTIAVLTLGHTDDITVRNTKRLISFAPEMYDLLDTLSRNLEYSNLSKNARRGIRDMLANIDYGMFTCPSKKPIAYAPALLDFIKTISKTKDDTEEMKSMRDEAIKLIEKIGDD